MIFPATRHDINLLLVFIVHAGGNLNYCRVDKFQCCTNDYFEKRGEAIERMIADDIQMEIEKQIDHLSDIVDAVEKGQPKNVFSHIVV